MKTIQTLFFSVFTLLISCKNDNCENTQKEVKMIMGQLYKRKINFPANMKVLMDSSIIKEKIPSQPKLKNYTIVHFFTADCDKCVNELKMIQKSLKNNLNNAKISYIFISSAPTPAYVTDAIKKTKFPYPIYYEKEYYSFKIMNALPISDNVYDTMLLNSNQEVILFGAFYDNEKARLLYSKVIECQL